GRTRPRRGTRRLGRPRRRPTRDVRLDGRCRAVGRPRRRAGRRDRRPAGDRRPGRGRSRTSHEPAVSDGDRPPLPVLLGLTGTPYEEALLAVLSRPGARLRVVRRCLDLADLLAAASTGEAGVAVVSPDLHRLDREAVAQLAASGVVAYGVVTAGDDA